MKSKKIIGIVAVISGVVLLVFSNYIAGQVEEGRAKADQAQSRVNMGKSLFSLTPATQEVGEGLSRPIQKRINAGREEIAHYEGLSGQLFIGGILLIIVGAGLFLWGFRRG